ncbi:hypothetical protein ASD55_11300 [Rhodanobacter sp. Root561]|uniref:hypothetical protein n=1 Tax=Rhodanobacter sp. Root561 TaxID=1736560 RepID=UPI0006F91ACA|nr:hypothetical protein [Rhodanobacter sp. Root561]KQZ72344.1 hypothetical protein ASD55_11300 [Rhodanobacter sp. Root561]
MFEEILKASGGRLLIPVVIAVVFVAIVKALFELRRSKLGERKDFLETWTHQRLQDDLWLEVTVRHLAGSYLPASVIRRLLGTIHPSRALLDVSECWELFDMDAVSGEIHWREGRHADPAQRVREMRLFGALYYLLTGLAGGLSYLLLATSFLPSGEWSVAFLLLLLGIFCLSRSETLKAAQTAAPRWLGLP